MTGNKNNAIYVVGHVNPDTDSIASAMGYAWLLQDQGQNAVAARAGHLNPQTTWVLNHLGIELPTMLTDASPRFAAISHRLNTAAPEHPLREVWSIANRTGGVAPIVDSEGKPFGLVSVISLFDFLSRTVGSHPRREEMRIGELMDMPGREACDQTVPQFQANARVRDALNRILREERTDFWVIDEAGRYVGICRHREALNPPRMQLILVDHNEPGQAVGSIDEADIIEIVDHHRLGNSSTRMPIRFTVDVVGSTSTLISERINDAGLSAPPELAGLLLAGVLSDTLILTSPTTTPRDHEAAERLARWAFVIGSPLAGETVQTFGEKVISSGTGLATRKPEEIVSADLKLYEAAGLNFGVAQVEVTSLVELDEHLVTLQEALVKLRDAKGLNFAVLMVTDVVRGSSRLLLTSDVPGLGGLPYPKLPDGTLRAAGVVSRKKQLLPALLSALEG
ncbi:putative Inorganic pyrophosphatase/exopolyphosphatase [Candidatus Promineifilum breve]|uniref:inorganic diphosphatase n=1 Tax=Candidatus Promineifilum breve TaxID=1806508 RepID=A0A160T1T9_9CHLR|nr:DHHA2 domain-containing protein [Candidatus Promineifilum breve]CUS02505.2 putative Inorganic pyrophosphatase/exopolyphosphatase [Candidatus Promineifilum breve]